MKNILISLLAITILYSCSTQPKSTKYKLITTMKHKDYSGNYNTEYDTTTIEATSDSMAYDNAYSNFMISCAVTFKSNESQVLSIPESFVCYTPNNLDVKTLLKPEQIEAINKNVESFSEVKDYLNKIGAKIDTTLFEILNTEQLSLVDNYYIFYKKEHFTKQDLIDFIKKFRTKYVNRKANVSLYDSKSVIRCMNSNYTSSSNKDYIELAEHYIAYSEFEIPDDIMFYPYQDAKYKSIGGKNFKKDKLK